MSDDMTTINKFTKFKRHTDNVGEVIESDDINKVQESVNELETENIATKDQAFTEKVLFTLENHFAVNSGFIDEFDDMQNVDIPNSNTIVFNQESSSIQMHDLAIKGTYYSKPIKGQGKTSFLNDFLLIVDIEKPKGSSVEYFISTNFGDFPISLDKENVTTIQEKILEFRIKIVMKPNNLGHSPIINSVGVLFFDLFLEKQYGLINPDLSRFDKQSFGETVLIRDRGLGDKLVRVISPDGVTDLAYRGDGKLDFIESMQGQDNTRTTLNYGDYYDSNNNISEKLLGTTSEEIKTEDTNKSPFEGGDE